MNKTKPKILVVTDSSFLSSGYGIYAKEILTRFHNSGEYEVAELGCYATTKNPKILDIPWKFYPNAVENNDERYKAYSSSPQNQFGAWRFNRVCAHFQPDIVLTWTDYWMYSYQEISPFRNYFYWIQMPMVDSAPQKIEWLYTYRNADMIIPYTEWAKKVLIDSCGNNIKIFDKPANAGINSWEFFPVSDKIEHKKNIMGFNGDIIGCVMRNQRRKLFADMMIAFKNYLARLYNENKTDKAENTFLYLHTTFPEANGWDLPSLLVEYELLDKVYFSYVCRSCNKYFPSKFKGAVAPCPHCEHRASIFPSVSQGVTTKDLNDIYNLFDIFIQSAIAEGFGIPQLEAAACGVPFASVDYSAMTEVAENLNGFKIPVHKKFREIETNADRVYPDNDYITQLMYDFFNTFSDQHKKELSNKTKEACVNKYSWDNVYSIWKICCDNMIKTGSQKLSWQEDRDFSTNHAEMKVSRNLTPKEFVEFICYNIINEPYLLSTSPVKMIIRDLNSKLIAKNNILQNFDYNQAAEILDSMIHNKIGCGLMLKTIKSSNEDFLICH